MAVANVAAVAVTIIAKTAGFNAGIKQAQRRMTSFQRTVHTLGRALRTVLSRGFRIARRAVGRFTRAIRNLLFSTKALLLGMMGAAGAGGLIGAAIKFAAEFDSAAFSMGKLLQSTTDAASIMEKLKRLAIATPFRFPGLLAGARSLAAFGVQTEKILPTLQAIGDATAAVGGDTATFARLVLGFGKIVSRTRLTVREMKAFVAAGVPILPELGKVLGLGDTGVLKAIEKGRVSAAHFERALANMTKEGTRFGNMMIEMSKRTLGLWEALKDTFILSFLIPLGDALIKTLKLKNVMAGLIEFIDKFGETAARSISVFINKWIPKLFDMLELVVQIGAVIVNFFSRLASGDAFAVMGKLLLRINLIMVAAAMALGFAIGEGILIGLKASGILGFMKDISESAAGFILPGLSLLIDKLENADAIGNPFFKIMGDEALAFAREFSEFDKIFGGLGQSGVGRFFQDTRDFFSTIAKEEGIVERVIGGIAENMMSLFDAINTFGAIGETPIVVVQKLEEAISRMAKTLRDFGLTTSQKFLADLKEMVIGFENVIEVMDLFTDGLRLALALAIKEAEVIARRFKLKPARVVQATIASVGSVGAVGPNTVESARLRFAANNPIFKIQQKVQKAIANSALKTALQTANIATTNKEMLRAIQDLAAAQAGTIGGP